MILPILVFVEDAPLRQQLFERLAAAGHRVDAVADRYHAQRRLFKDEYALVVALEGADPPASDEVELLSVAPEELSSPGALERRVAAALGEL